MWLLTLALPFTNQTVLSPRAIRQTHYDQLAVVLRRVAILTFVLDTVTNLVIFIGRARMLRYRIASFGKVF